MKRFIRCQRSIKNFLIVAISIWILGVGKAEWLVNSFTLCLTSAVYSLLFSEWGSALLFKCKVSLMDEVTHPCIIDGGRKPLTNHTRLGFYSKLCPASMLMLMSTVSYIMYLCSRLEFCSLVIYCVTLGVSCHITPSFIWHWNALLLTLALVVLSF